MITRWRTTDLSPLKAIVVENETADDLDGLNIDITLHRARS